MTLRPKIQHRYLVPPDKQHALMHLPATRIVQAFFGPNLSFCARIVDGNEADLTRTLGHGYKRFMIGPSPLELSTAEMLMAGSRGRIIRFDRRHKDGIKLDYLDLPFERVMLAEREKDDESQAFTLPPWLEGAIDVTGSLSKRALANAVRYLDAGRTVTYEQVRSRNCCIAVTGSPCSGKSKLRDDLIEEFKERALIQFLREVATNVLEGGVNVPKDPIENRLFQIGVYDLQNSFEELADLEARLTGKRLIVCDRGTLDGCAYLAGGKPEFLRIMDTTEAEEFARYDRVVMLAPPPRAVWDELKASGDPAKWNMQRKETYEQALDLSHRIHDIWSRHPGFHYVEGNSWEEKAAKARAAILTGIIDL